MTMNGTPRVLWKYEVENKMKKNGVKWKERVNYKVRIGVL